MGNLTVLSIIYCLIENVVAIKDVFDFCKRSSPLCDCRIKIIHNLFITILFQFLLKNLSKFQSKVSLGLHYRNGIMRKSLLLRMANSTVQFMKYFVMYEGASCTLPPPVGINLSFKLDSVWTVK